MMKDLILKALLIQILLSGCFNVQKDELDATPIRQDSLAMAELFEPEPILVQKKADQPSMLVCQKEYAKVVFTLRKLREALGQDPEDSLANSIAKLAGDPCILSNFKKTSQIVQQFLKEPLRNIGVIAAKEQNTQEIENLFWHGLALSVGKEKELLPRLRVKKIGHGEEMRALAELVFHDQVGLVILALGPEVTASLLRQTQSLKLTSLQLTREPNVISEEGLVFRIYPHERDLAASLGELTKAKNLTQLWALRPESGKSDSFIKAYEGQLKKQGMAITKILNYEPGDFASMDKAVKEIALGLELSITGISQVVSVEEDSAPLPVIKIETPAEPSLAHAAVLIPDNFKAVRYFAKLFDFYRAKGITLLGYPEWRSKDLINPWDSVLEGAAFVDFVGAYSDLPLGFELGALSGPYLVGNDYAGRVDAQLIGWRSGSLVKVLLGKKNLGKDQVAGTLRRAFEREPNGRKSPWFYDDQTLRWKAYCFELAAGRLVLARRP